MVHDGHSVHNPRTRYLSAEFASQGQEVYEALAISEVLALAEQHPTSSIVITPDVDQGSAALIDHLVA